MQTRPMPEPNIDGLIIESPELMVDKMLLEIKNRGTEPELPTGIAPLDSVIWGYRRKAVTVIAARTGHGKSSLAGYTAFHLASLGKKVIYLSLEMPKEEILERMMCNYCDFDGELLRRNNLPADFDSRAEEFKKYVKNQNIRIIDGYGSNIEEVKSLFQYIKSEDGKKEDKPDILFIDHLQKITSLGYVNRTEAVTDYINTLEKIALRKEIAVVAVAQINREAVKGKPAPPRLEHLKDAGAIEETGATVLMCWWRTKDEENDPRSVDYKIIVAKQRHGAAGETIPLYFYASKSRFSETPAATWTPKNGSEPATGIEASQPPEPTEVPF